MERKFPLKYFQQKIPKTSLYLGVLRKLSLVCHLALEIFENSKRNPVFIKVHSLGNGLFIYELKFFGLRSANDVAERTKHKARVTTGDDPIF